MPVPVSSIGPLKAVVPPVRFATDTECAADPVTVAATVTLAGAAVEVDAVAACARDGHLALVVPTDAVVTPVPLIPAPLGPVTLRPSTSTPFASWMRGARRVGDHRRRARGDEHVAVDRQPGALADQLLVRLEGDPAAVAAGARVDEDRVAGRVRIRAAAERGQRVERRARAPVTGGTAVVHVPDDEVVDVDGDGARRRRGAVRHVVGEGVVLVPVAGPGQEGEAAGAADRRRPAAGRRNDLGHGRDRIAVLVRIVRE